MSTHAAQVYDNNVDSVKFTTTTVVKSHNDATDLKEQNADLENQVRKLSDDYKNLRRRLEEAEDKNSSLEEQNKLLETKLACCKEAAERVKDELEREVSELTESFESTKEKITDYVARISKHEKDYHELFEEKEALCEYRDKSDNETQRLISELADVAEYIKEQEARFEGFEEQIKRLLEKGASADLEIRRLNNRVEELNISNEKLEREKHELENPGGLSMLDYTVDSNSLDLSCDDAMAEIDSSFSMASPFPRPKLQNSLFAEITASIERNPVTPLFLFSKPVVCDASTQVAQVPLLNPVYQAFLRILEVINMARREVEVASKIGDGDHDSNDDYRLQKLNSVEGDASFRISGLIEGTQDCDGVVEESEMVRRINEELAEFREQLKRSQELFHSLSNSTQNFTITKSCPGLVEVKEEDLVPDRPCLVTISTQTDCLQEVDAQIVTRNTDDEVDPGENSNAFQKLTIEDGESRYRAADALFTVIEESEHEAELSPAALHRRMSSEKGTRPKLVRMPNTIEDPPLGEDDIKSDLDYLSAASSLSGSKNPSTYNSLERPLQVSHLDGPNGNGDELSDTCSTISGGNTTYGSPISSPSSPTYWTPSQGSSSQETLTNRDGDKTPINDDDFLGEETDRVGSLSRTENRSRNSKQRSPTWDTPMLPIDNRHGSFSIGAIPDAEQAHMKHYAYDVVARSCDKDADILSRNEWRTLKSDLERVDLGKYKKIHGQEEDTEEGGSAKPSSSMDLDEEAEKYYETFPYLVEKIFQTLDKKIRQDEPDELQHDEIPQLSKRFEELATAFKTDHEKLGFRTELTKKEYDNARMRMSEISSSLKKTMQRMREEKISGEIREVFNSIENSTAELDLHSESLDRAAMRAGRLDVEKRVFKLIEVMVFYVRIIKNIHGTKENELVQAKQLLEERGIPFPSKKTQGSLHHNNNNNHEKVTSSQEELGEGSTMGERTDDGKSQHIFQHLLGPKSSGSGPSHNNSTLVLTQKGPPRNFLLRYLSEGYGMIRRELYWPWTWDQSWSGIRRGFTLVLMFLGFLLILQSVIPGSGAKANDCSSTEYNLLGRLCSQFVNYGQLSHSRVPRY